MSSRARQKLLALGRRAEHYIRVGRVAKRSLNQKVDRYARIARVIQWKAERRNPRLTRAAKLGFKWAPVVGEAGDVLSHAFQLHGVKRNKKGEAISASRSAELGAEWDYRRGKYYSKKTKLARGWRKLKNANKLADEAFRAYGYYRGLRGSRSAIVRKSWTKRRSTYGPAGRGKKYLKP